MWSWIPIVSSWSSRNSSSQSNRSVGSINNDSDFYEHSLLGDDDLLFGLSHRTHTLTQISHKQKWLWLSSSALLCWRANKSKDNTVWSALSLSSTHVCSHLTYTPRSLQFTCVFCFVRFVAMLSHSFGIAFCMPTSICKNKYVACCWYAAWPIRGCDLHTVYLQQKPYWPIHRFYWHWHFVDVTLSHTH